ncbi:MAG TPA: hypothetical protein VFL86_13400 [Burkholderiaceae bacterium]|nr:hypothetical protein [Burkholderiaceae bacterium]
MSGELHDIPPDAHLQAALRHAPDHRVAPPPDLSAQILAQAHQAVAAEPAALSWPGRLRLLLRALDRWLSQPALAGAVATLALATVIGLMWRSGAPTDGGPELAEATVPAAAPVAARPEAADKATADRPAADAALAAAPQPALAAAPPARPSPPVRSAKAPAPQPSQAPVTAAAAGAEPAAVPSPRAEAAQEAAPAALASASTPEPLGALLATLREQPDTVQVMPAAQVPARADLRVAKSLAAADTARERSVVRQVPAAPAPASAPDADAAGREWLAQVARAAEGRWQRAAASAADEREAGHGVWIDGAVAGWLVLTDRGVRWRPATGPAWHADLDAAALQTLRTRAPRH